MLKKEFIDTIFQFFIGSQQTAHYLKDNTMPDELTQVQYNILEMLYFTPTKGVSDFASCLHLSMPNASRETKKLVEKGFLVKEQDGQDKRKQNLHITEKGKKTMDKTIQLIVENINSLQGHLNENDQDEIMHSMQNIIDKFFSKD